MQLLSRSQRLDWIRLAQTENVGPQTFRSLISRFGGASAALEALPELSNHGGLRRPLRIFSADAAEAALARVDELGGSFVAAGERGYPPLLHFIAGAPPLLCVMGDLDLAELECVAIVGARNASAGGIRLARQLSAELSEEGFLVTSGLASTGRRMNRPLTGEPRRWWRAASTSSIRRSIRSCNSSSAARAF
jgi:DNA processing protein